MAAVEMVQRWKTKDGKLHETQEKAESWARDGAQIEALKDDLYVLYRERMQIQEMPLYLFMKGWRRLDLN